MKKIRQWMTRRFLPVYLKEALLKENERLLGELREKEIHIRELNAYIEGLEFALRAQRKLVIRSGEGKS